MVTKARTLTGIAVLMALPFFLSNCSFLVNRMAFFPDRDYSIPAAQLPLNVKEVFIPTADRKKLQSYYLKSDTGKIVVIYFHGNGGNIAQRLPELMHFYRMGVSVLGVGYRGYGRSTGRPSEAGIYQDGKSALAYAKDTLGFKPAQVVVCGRSIGTTAAMNTAAGQEVGGLILVTPLTTGREYARAHGLGAFSFLAGGSFKNTSRCGKIKCPVLVIHGTKDEVIPYWMGEEIFKKLAASDKKFVTIKNGFHNDLEIVDPETYWNSIQEFLSSLSFKQ
jgi:hypothetical protein